jgi:hypothetical protein
MLSINDEPPGKVIRSGLSISVERYRIRAVKKTHRSFALAVSSVDIAKREDSNRQAWRATDSGKDCLERVREGGDGNPIFSTLSDRAIELGLAR